MGPLHFTAGAANLLTWAHYFSGSIVDEFGWAHCNLLPLLPIFSLGLIFSSGGSLDALRWAHCNLLLLLPICSLGPIISQEKLLMLSDRPIALTAASANFLTWTHYFFKRYCQ